MKMSNIIWVLFLALLSSCQPGENKMHFSAQDRQVISKGLNTYDDSTRSLTIDQLISDTVAYRFKPNPHHIISYKISNNTHWISFPVNLKADNSKYLEFPAGMVEYIYLYVVDGNQRIVSQDSIRWNTSTSKRKIKSWRNAFPLTVSHDGRYMCYVKTFKNNGSLQIPVVLWQPEEFHKSQYYRALYYGFVFGVFCIIILLSFSICISLKDIKYLYYGLYILFVSLWRLWIEGLVMELMLDSLPGIVYPFYANIPMVLGIGFILLFYREFVIKTFEQNKQLFLSIINILAIAVFALLSLSFVSKGNYTLYFYLFYIYYGLGAVLILFFVGSLIYGVFLRNTNAIIYLLSTAPFLFNATFSSLANNKIIKHSFFFYDNLLWTVFFEVVILTFALGIEFRSLMVQRRKLLVEIHKQDKAMYETKHLFQQEKIQRLEAEDKLRNEKERLSRDLHDSLGTDLSNIIYNLDFVNLLSKKNEYHQIIDKVEYIQKYSRKTMQQLRSAIWILNNQSITIEEFVSKLHAHILDQLSDTHDIKYQITIDNDIENVVLPSVYALALFRVSQESISNTLKYAQAQHIDISWGLTAHHQLIYIIKDDGIGMNLSEALNRDSHGLKNIYQRITELKEEIMFDSKEGLGTKIKIVISNLKPYINHP